MTIDNFGSYFRQKRLEQNLTLRGFCQRYGIDTAYISRVENNKIKPPRGKRLSALAKALNISKNSQEWITFFDLAHQSRSELPKDLNEEAPEILSMLPAFLRTPDGKRISKKKVEELISFLKTNKK